MSQQPPDNSDPQQPDASSRQQADSSTSQNVVQGKQNRVVQGDNNKSVLGDNNTVIQGNNNWLGHTWNIFFGRSDSTELTNPRNRVQQLLLKQVSTEVESRVSSSLHNRIYIVQDTEQNPSQIELPWASEIKVGSKPKVHLTNTEITTLYDQPDIAGRLLILGEPGLGKTTMLLKLAEELVNRAKSDSGHLIPVLFSLSSWKNDNQSIKDWLIDQLKDKYGVRKDIGKQWVENQEIIPLLDGLDEIVAERQELCVKKINDFLHPETWSNPLVVCSRIEEYQRYKALLQLNNSLELCPLNKKQVCQYLQNTGHLQLWDSISQDADLIELAKIPLFLNIIVLSAQEISIQTWQEFRSFEERISYLFNAYIRRMLKRPYKGKQFKHEYTLRWLGKLAERLVEENATDFLIERIQPNWLKTKIQRFTYNSVLNIFVFIIAWSLIPFQHFLVMLIGLICGHIIRQNEKLRENIPYFYYLELNSPKICSILLLIKFLISDQYFHVISLIYDLIYWLIFGLIAGLTIVWNANTPIRTLEKFSFSVKKFFNRLLYLLKAQLKLSLVFTLSFVPILLLISFIIAVIINGNITNLHYDTPIYLLILAEIVVSFGILISILSLGVLSSVFDAVLYGINKLEVENKTIPNQAIIQSFINNFIILFGIIISNILLALILKLIFILSGQLINPLLTLILQNKKNLDESTVLGSDTSTVLGSDTLLYFIHFIIVFVILFCGTPAIRHFVLRVILWFNGYAPWNYAKFLDYCTNRLFLQRVGGGYRFIHDLLRQHFTNSYTQTNLTSTYSNPRTVQEGKFKNILLVAGVLMLMGYWSWQYQQETIASVYYIRGLIYYQKEDYDRAIEDYNKVIELNPNDAIAYKDRGLAYHYKKDYNLAIEDYNKAIELNPKFTEAYIIRGTVYDDLEDYDLAIEDYSKAIELNPKYVTVYNNRGLAYYHKKDYDLAIEDYNKAIELNPKYFITYIIRGTVYDDLKDYDLAIEDYSKAIELNPKYFITYNNRGSAYYHKKDYDLAIEDYNKAIELNPRFATAYYNRGFAYSDLEDYYRAIEDYNKAIELNPNDAIAYKDRGLAYYYKKDYDLAIEDCNKAIELNPKYATAYNNRGLIYDDLEDYDRAIEDYNKAIEFNPKFATAYYNRGFAYKNKGRKDKAVEDFKTTLELNNDVELSEIAKQQLQELSTK